MVVPVKEAIRSGARSNLKKPVKPTLKKKNSGKMETNLNIINKLELYKWEYPQYLKDKRQCEMDNKQIYMRFKRHTSSAMETKLESMPEYDSIVSSQDKLGSIELLKKIYFEQDASKQQLAEIANADK